MLLSPNKSDDIFQLLLQELEGLLDLPLLTFVYYVETHHIYSLSQSLQVSFVSI